MIAAMITITTRALGSRRKLLDDWAVPPPEDLAGDGGRMTLRDLPWTPAGTADLRGPFPHVGQGWLSAQTEASHVGMRYAAAGSGVSPSGRPRISE